MFSLSLVAIVSSLFVLVGEARSDDLPELAPLSAADLNGLSFVRVDPSRGGASEQVLAMIRRVADDTPANAQRVSGSVGIRIGEVFAEGVDLNHLGAAFGDVGVKSRPGVVAGLGIARSRSNLYSTMLEWSRKNVDSDRERVKAVSRASVALSFMDFAAVPREAWVAIALEPSVHTLMGLSEVESGSLSAFAVRVRDSSSGQMSRLLKIGPLLPGLHELDASGHMDREKLVEVVELVESIWSDGEHGPLYLLMTAAQMWKLHCLAVSKADAHAMEVISELSRELQGVARSTVETRWAAEIVMPGPAPEGPLIRRLRPEDVRGSEPR